MSAYNIDISNKNKTIHNIPLTFKCKEVTCNTYLAIFYRMSSFFYAIAGILVFIFYNQMKEYDKNYMLVLLYYGLV